MKILLTLLFAATLGICHGQEGKERLYHIPEVFDMTAMTDSTRFRPVFGSIVPHDYDFSIYDKWGQVIFHTDIYEQGWNGRANNRNYVCTEGSYMWTLSFENAKDTSKHVASGFVTVVKAKADVAITGLDTLQCQPMLFVPDAFTPNGDGPNDVFQPTFGCPPTEYGFFIFDRWGNLIFQSTNPSDGWDGNSNGQYMQVGVYVWRIKCRFYPGDRLRVYTGHVDLIR